MQPILRELTLDDYDAALALWKRCEGIGIGAGDTREGIAQFLARNPGLSFVIETQGQVIGTALSGHDGRRGFIYHLAVDSIHRQKGHGRKLVHACLEQLRRRGLQKTHIVVYANNQHGQEFWLKLGWVKRDNLLIMSTG